MNPKYSKIIHLTHHVSGRHAPMTMYQRAAQFAPFAALTGHSAVLNETARMTENRIELSESECALLDRNFALLLAHIHEQPNVCLTYFVPDLHKEGGSYALHEGKVRKWDDYEQVILFDDGTRVPRQDIIDLVLA